MPQVTGGVMPRKPVLYGQDDLEVGKAKIPEPGAPTGVMPGPKLDGPGMIDSTPTMAPAPPPPTGVPGAQPPSAPPIPGAQAPPAPVYAPQTGAGGVQGGALPTWWTPPSQGTTDTGGAQGSISGAYDKSGNWNDYTSGVQNGQPPAWWQPPIPDKSQQDVYLAGSAPPAPPVQPNAAGQPGAPGAPGAPAAGTPGQPTQQNQLADMVRKSIMDQLGAGPYDPQQDPLFQSQAGAYRTAQQRAQERDRSALAERNVASGGSVGDGSWQTDMNSLNQIRGENEAGFESTLAGNLNQQREQKIQNALNLGAGFLSQQDQASLQRELAQLQASTAKDLQSAQFGFQGGQSALDRAQQTALQSNQFGFQGGQSALDRALSQQLQGNQFAFQGGQSALDRLLSQTLQGNQFAFQGGQNAQDRSLQQLLQGNQLGFNREALQSNDALQRWLADLQSKSTSRGQDIQQQLGQGDIDLRRMLGNGQLSLGFLNSLLGRTNFLDDLGFNYANLQNSANRDALLHALGG